MQIFCPFFQAWTQADDRGAFQTALGLQDVRQRQVPIEAIAKSASPEGAGRITQLLLQTPENRLPAGDQLLATAITNWNQTSPAEAAEVLLTDPMLRSDCGGEVLRN